MKHVVSRSSAVRLRRRCYVWSRAGVVLGVLLALFWAVSNPSQAYAADAGALAVSPGKSDIKLVSSSDLGDVSGSAVFTVPSERTVYLSVQLRSRSNGDGYRAKARIDASGSVSLAFSRVDMGQETALDKGSEIGLSVKAGQKLVVQGMVTGSSPVKLSARAWVQGGAEPGWQQTYSDGSSGRIASAGAVRLWAYLSASAASSTSVPFSSATAKATAENNDQFPTAPAPEGSERYPASPPAAICGNSTLLAGPASPPNGAIVVPSGDNSSVNFRLAGRTYWFAPGVHTLGSGRYDAIIPGANSTFVGGPGAVIDGKGLNAYAFTGQASGVAVRYLTVRNFVAPMNEGTVNHDSGKNWTVSYNTITNNGGAGLFLGSGNVASYNCLKSNSQYGFQGYGPSGGESNITLDHNEITGNNTGDWEAKQPGCGCTGGGKFWDVRDVKVTANYVHGNKSVGLWADTNNNNFLFDGNWIEGNDGQAIFWETSYNAAIRNNVILNNLTVQGPKRIAAGDNFPDAAIYISEAGGDSRLPYGLVGSATIDISGNLIQNNYNGVALWENADRFCGSPANTSSGYCTLVNPKATTTTCSASNISKAPYYSDCRWKTQNVKVHDNSFKMDRSAFKNCSASMCGRNAIFSNWGSYPSWSPYKGDVIQKAISQSQGNVFSNNTYTGGWNFTSPDTGHLLNPSAWRAANQDIGSTFS